MAQPLGDTGAAAFPWDTVDTWLTKDDGAARQWQKILILAPDHACLLEEAFRLLEECCSYQV